MSPMNPRLLRPTTSVHPEAGDWANRVRSNGGSVSGSTLNAVSQFCRAIDAAGLRGRFSRLNLICGNNLEAAVVPLYRSTSVGGTILGGAIDTSNAFVGVGTDYAETGASGGLLGNGSSKYLDTGLTQATIGVTGHHAFYHDRSGAKAASRALGGATNSARTQRYASFAATNTNGIQSTFGGTANTNTSGASPGFIVTTRRGNTDLEQYQNGASSSTNTASASASTISINFGVFVVLGASDTNAPDGAFGYWDDRIKAYSFGLDMTGSQVTAYYNAMQAFQTALGRNA